jgi:hypothetical protein
MPANFAKVFKNGTAAVKKKKKKKKKLKDEKNHASLCWKFYLFGGAAAALSSNCIRIYPPNRWMDQASSSAAPILDFPEPKKKESQTTFGFYKTQ